MRAKITPAVLEMITFILVNSLRGNKCDRLEKDKQEGRKPQKRLGERKMKRKRLRNRPGDENQL